MYQTSDYNSHRGLGIKLERKYWSKFNMIKMNTSILFLNYYRFENRHWIIKP